MAKPSRQDVEDITGTSPGQLFIRWFFYVGFMICSTMTVVLLGLGGAWWAPMIGCIPFGIPTVIAYLNEQERQQNLETVRLNQLAMAAANDNNDNWDMGGDTDPTVPPAPRERTR